jgi:two-component system nitrate/nitrite response regulator NarL
MKTLIVEDQALFRDFLVAVLERNDQLLPIGTAADGEEALEVFKRHQPRLVLLDILIPEHSGIIVAKKILSMAPLTRIIAISAEKDPKTLHQVQRLRLSGFIDKNATNAVQLNEAIQQVLKGGTFFSESFLATLKKLRADPNAFHKILSKREQEFLTLVGAGLGDEEIAEALGIREASVPSHRQNLFRKLGLHSNTELVRYAHETGFWKPEFNDLNLRNSYHWHE